jgi:hydrogenase nickel incorporation protein HypB
MKVTIEREILGANDDVARENRAAFAAAGVFALNLMASPGAGKTSVILATIARLPAGTRAGVIEGDLASRIDADAIAARGIPVVQINTGGNCHLDAPMLRTVMPALPLAALDLLFVENVGNLVCTANFELGTHRSLVVASVPEGHDKPYKYPFMFARADVVLLNKADLLDLLEFDLESFRRGVAMVNPDAAVLPVSCRTGAGFDAWLAWLERAQAAHSPA